MLINSQFRSSICLDKTEKYVTFTIKSITSGMNRSNKGFKSLLYCIRAIELLQV